MPFKSTFWIFLGPNQIDSDLAFGTKLNHREKAMANDYIKLEKWRLEENSNPETRPQLSHHTCSEADEAEAKTHHDKMVACEEAKKKFVDFAVKTLGVSCVHPDFHSPNWKPPEGLVSRNLKVFFYENIIKYLSIWFRMRKNQEKMY